MGFYSRVIFPWLCDLTLRARLLSEAIEQACGTFDHGKQCQVAFGSRRGTRRRDDIEEDPGTTSRPHSDMPCTDLVERIIRSRSGGFERTLWTLTPRNGQAVAAIIFLDGELYVERVMAAGVVQRLQECAAIPPVASVFVSNGGAAARHDDFACCPEYAKFIAKDLVGSISIEHPTVHEFIIAGLSLSGLMAAYAATRYPEVFRTAICQSPSLWWERGRFYQELPLAGPGMELWICVGSQETDSGISHPPSGLLQEMTQVAGCTRAAAALREKGYSVSYREFNGGHDPECWREDLALALPWVWRRTWLPSKT